MVQRAVPRRGMGESGAILTELAVSLPVFVLLLTFLAFAVAASWRSYQRQTADAELHQELQIALARVVESALLSDRINPHWQGGYDMRQNLLTDRSMDRYWTDGGKLILNYASYPITGDFSGAGVDISEFSIVPDGAYPRLYRIRLTGKSRRTGRSHTVETAVYLREDAYAKQRAAGG